MLRRRLILAGGGGAEESAALDRRFADWTGNGPMLYLPVAMDRADYEPCHAWITSTFHPLGVHDIDMRTEVTRDLIASLPSYRSIYIGGGNTYRLLDLARRTGLDVALSNAIAQGQPVYGGSAGAILLGRDIATCAHLDDNLVGLADTSGLDLAAGHSVWCHHKPEEDHQRLLAYTSAHSEPVFAIPETAGLVLESNTALVFGTSPVTVYVRNGDRCVLKPGDTLAV